MTRRRTAVARTWVRRDGGMVGVCPVRCTAPFHMRRLPALACAFAMLASGCELVMGGIPDNVSVHDGGPESAKADDVYQVTPKPPQGGTPQSTKPAADAAASAGDAPDAPCPTWYPDQDQDGYGVVDGARSACAQPSGSWATRSGDCADDEPRAHPRQTTYFPEPYAGSDGLDSYDYDCSGTEEGDPRQATAAGNCKILQLSACGGSGYLATRRTGPGRNAYCGSLSMESCEASIAVVICESVHETVEDAYRCR